MLIQSITNTAAAENHENELVRVIEAKMREDDEVRRLQVRFGHIIYIIVCKYMCVYMCTCVYICAI